MSGILYEVRAVDCPGCGQTLDLGEAQTHPSMEALLAHVEAKIDAHAADCAPARARLAAEAAQGEASA